MVAVIFRAKIQDGKEEEAYERLRGMCAAVQDAEPGTLAYVCYRDKEDPKQIIFYEQYADDAAFGAHAQTPHMGVLRDAFSTLFDTSQVKLERLDRVAGFIRPEAE